MRNPQLLKPFFSFDFYKFTFRSDNAMGDHPNFNMRQKYQLEDSEELRDYLQNQFLKIIFADESGEFFEDSDL
jgi:hypothetical protein